MKTKILIAVAAVALCSFMFSCVKEEGFENRVREIVQADSLRAQVEALAAQMRRMNTDISSLQKVVSALEKNLYITKVEETEEGCKLTFSDGKTVTIKNGKDGKDGKDAPVVGVKDSLGVYYWVLVDKTKTPADTSWILDKELKKIPISGKDGAEIGVKDSASVLYWVRIDKTTTPPDTTYLRDKDGKQIQAEGKDGESIFSGIDTTKTGYVVLTLASGTKIELPYKSELDKLASRIQSIEVVPMYGDGSVDIATGDNELRFDIRPAFFADSLVKTKGKSAFSLLMTGRDERPGTKASSFSQVILSGVSFDAEDSVVVVKFRGNGMPSGFFDGTAAQQGTLRISDGNIDKGSAYFAAEPLLSANCFVQGNSANGTFKAVKGNSNIPVGKVASVAVLWESFGTSTPPASGDVVNNAPTYSGGWISYSTGANNGNALIAAKDASGTILWSWHIWVCNGFNPETTAQLYNNDAGTMMDRNLGATSADKGQVSALGLMYQWGRKDPFLGSSSISSSAQAASTPSQWPDPIAAQDNSSDSELNLRTSIQNPTTFIFPPDMIELDDWYCTIYELDNDTLWNTSSGKKTIYDPCPAGWRIPFEDGDENGVWSKASSDKTAPGFDGTNMGFNFGGTDGYFTTATTCWYPAAGIITPEDGTLASVGEVGYYWSCTSYDYQSVYLYFDKLGQVFCGDQHDSRAEGQPVRCVRE